MYSFSTRIASGNLRSYSHQIHYNFEQFSQNNVVITKGLTDVLQQVDQIKGTMVTKDDLVRQQGILLAKAQPRHIDGQGRTQNTHSEMILTTTINWNRQTVYELPVGTLKFTYGWGVEKSSQEREYSARGSWEFQPASWFSHRAFLTEAALRIQCIGQLVRPSLKVNLRAAVVLSDDHPIFRCIDDGDVKGVRQLLDDHAFGAEDTNRHGYTIIHSAASHISSNLSSANVQGTIEILRLLINIGVDCNQGVGGM